MQAKLHAERPGCWYTVCCKMRQEGIAQENLQRQGFHVYLPLLKLRRRRCGKWIESVGALFPRYLFIRVDAGQRSLAPVRSTRGVCNLVRFGLQAALVPDQIIYAIRSRADAATGLHIEAMAELKSGDAVRLVDGPLAGMAAMFDSDSGEGRVLLLLELLGKANQVAVRRDWVEKAA